MRAGSRARGHRLTPDAGPVVAQPYHHLTRDHFGINRPMCEGVCVYGDTRNAVFPGVSSDAGGGTRTPDTRIMIPPDAGSNPSSYRPAGTRARASRLPAARPSERWPTPGLSTSRSCRAPSRPARAAAAGAWRGTHAHSTADGELLRRGGRTTRRAPDFAWVSLLRCDAATSGGPSGCWSSNGTIR